MLERDNKLATEQKALAINLDERHYGTIAEIGAGQEVARIFFQAGAAAGTVAKTMSAYDMQFSDAIYGTESSGRYVSKSRLMQMLEHEFALVVERLTEVRPKNSMFFSYAATVTAKSFKRKHECHGWIGIRLQLHPGADPSDIVLHVRMLDPDNRGQAEALGILGVNLIYGAFHCFPQPKQLIESLNDNLGYDRIEVDLIEFSGPYFEETENRLMNLHLIHGWLTRAVMFCPDGQVMVPGELLYKKSVLAIRGSFKPVTKVNVDMIEAGLQEFLQVAGVAQDRMVTLAEITMASLISGDQVDDADFLARVDLLTSLGYTVMISDYVRYFSLRAYFRRYTQKEIGIVLGVLNIGDIFNEKYYDGLEGGILEAFGKLFPDHTRLYVYPALMGENSELTTVETAKVPQHLRYLYQHLLENKLIIGLDQCDENLLHIYSRQVFVELQGGHGRWEEKVPEVVAQQIIERRLLGFDSE